MRFVDVHKGDVYTGPSHVGAHRSADGAGADDVVMIAHCLDLL